MSKASNIELTVTRSHNYLGLPVDGEYVVTFYTESTHKGVGRELRDAVRVWSKWFKACGASETVFVTKRPQYHYSHSGSLTLGTLWAVRVTI